MKKLFILSFITTVFCSSAFARDDVGAYSIADAMATEQAKAILGNQVTFYFGEAAPSGVSKNFGEFRTNKKTNAFNKSDKEACEWAFLSAMVSLRDRALSEGGNAVIKIKSNYKNNVTVSDSTFQCGAGAVMSGVALIGTVAVVE